MLDITCLSFDLSFDPLPHLQELKNMKKGVAGTTKINEENIFCSEDVATQPSVAEHSTKPCLYKSTKVWLKDVKNVLLMLFGILIGW